MNPVFQINYGATNKVVVEMFVRLAQNMLNEELVAGVPKIVVMPNGNPKIVQLYGLSNLSSGSLCTFKLVGEDLWEVSYEDGDEKAVLTGPDIHKWFTGDY